MNGYTSRGSNLAVFILCPSVIFGSGGGGGGATVRGKNLLPKEEGGKFLRLRADPFWKCSVAHGSNQEFTEVASFRKGDGNIHLGPVVQSIISLTSSLRGQLVKCFMTL